MSAKVDFYVGIFLIVLSAGVFFMTGEMPQKENGLGPGDYPRVIIYCVAFLGLIQTISAYLKFRSRDKDEAKVKVYETREILNVFLLTLCVGVYLFLMPYFGFIVLTPFLMFVMMFLFGLRKWIKMVIISIVSTAVVYFLFDKFFLVLLPRFSLF